MSLVLFICNRSLEDSDRSDIDIKFFYRKVIQYQMQFVINSKVQVIVLGFTAVVRLVISSIGLRYVIKMEISDILIRVFQICLCSKWKTPTFRWLFSDLLLKETTNPEYIETFSLTVSRMDFVT